MKVRTFQEMVAARIANVNSCVCLGLDSDSKKLPQCVKRGGFKKSVFKFNSLLLEATHDLLLAVKFNLAFYIARGGDGVIALRNSIDHCRTEYPGVITILDAKWGDIGNSNDGYSNSTFRYFGADAVTVQPYLGKESLEPFLDKQDKGIIVLCKTSNPGGGEFQDLMMRPPEGEIEVYRARLLNEHGQLPLYQYVASQVAHKWNKNGNCALVVGATYPEEAARVRKIVGKMPLLLPGFGRQRAAVEDIVPVAQDGQGGGIMANSSRGIIFASPHPDFAEAGRQNMIVLRDEINRHRKVA